jgi:glutathione synthase/RimK-type ligase-like ATP-grasp enzyme
VVERVLVQEFLPEIAAGELAGVFFDGVFSHGLRRVPATGEFRINARYGGRMLAADLAAPVVWEMRRCWGSSRSARCTHGSTACSAVAGNSC